MTTILPTFQTTNPPSQNEMLDAFGADLVKNFNCCRPGVIVEYSVGDSKTVPHAKIMIAQKQVTSVKPDGTRTLADFAQLENVPVWFAGGGGFSSTWPVNPGDQCLVLFFDRQIDNFMNIDNAQPPSIPRMHDFSDAVALIGFRSNPRALSGVSATAYQVRSDDGQTIIELAPNKISLIADEVVIHARNKLCYDAGGTGTVIQPTQIDNYTDGVPVTNHAPTPPEVPT